MRGLNDWRVRTFYLSCLILIPFLKFVASNEYGFLHIEVGVAVLLLAGACVLLALVGRGIGFYILTTLCLTVMATYPAERLARFPAAVPPWLCAVAIAALTWLAARKMREKFFLVMAVFAGSGLLVELALHAGSSDAGIPARAAPPTDHVLWLIPDEHIGLAGFPTGLPQCVSAKERLQRTLEQYNFRIFPEAYSNYPVTVDSIPSILNGKLIRWPGELMPRVGTGQMRHYAVRSNRLFEEFAAKGYHIVAWQHAALRFCTEDPGRVECREYEEKLKWLHRAPGSWTGRFRWLVGSYQSSDPWLLRLRGFFPFRFGIKITGPLALEGLWPDGLAARILTESHKTLFFAHLLTPHSPYLFRRDGSIRPLEEWSDDRADHLLSDRKYQEVYCRYCEQAEHVAGELDRLLLRLDQAGVLQRMTVVIHGDHGSRILRASGHAIPASALEEEDSVSPEMLTFQAEPGSRDLVDRFSALLAVKAAGAAHPAVCDESHSLLTFLSRVVLGREPEDGVERADKVYLADSQQRLVAINMQRHEK